MSFFVGSCVLLISIAKDIKQDLCTFQTEETIESKSPSQVQLKLCEIVELYCNAKELSL